MTGYTNFNENRFCHLMAKFDWLDCQAERVKPIDSNYVFKTEREKIEEKHKNSLDI